MSQPSVLEGASNSALSPWVERDISPGWKETNWACPEHSHFTARQVCGVCVCEGNIVCLRSYARKGVSIQQHRSGSSASYWLYVQKNDLLIRSSSGFAAYESFRKPRSLSDPHRLRAEKPGAGIGFHLPAQQTQPGGGKKRLLPQWLETTVKSMWLLSLVAISSGWNGAQAEEEEGALLFGDEKEKCLDFHRMACRLSDSLPENVSQGLSHTGTFIVDSTKTTWQRRRLNSGRRAVFI